MERYLSLFLAILFLAAEISAAGPKDWEKAFSKDGVYKDGTVNVVVYYFDKCLAPGSGREVVAEPEKEVKVEEPTKGPFNSEAEWENDKLKKAKENVQHYNEEIAYVKEQLKSLDPDADYEEVENLKIELKANQAMLEIAQESLNELEVELAKKEQPKAEEEKPSESKKPAEAEKPAEEEGDKKPPRVKETHEVATKEYYNVMAIAKAAEYAYQNINSWLQAGLKWQYANTKIYLVTSPKMWNSLKITSKMFSPARNVCWDTESQSVLLFASPQIKDKLALSAAFAAASVAFDQALAVVNQNSSEVPDIISYGLRAKASALDAVVDLNKITQIELLKEKELLLPSELLNPTRMNDSKRCFYFIKQSKAIVDFFGTNRIKEYLKVAKGGNSGFRTSYQNIINRAEWAWDYDDFCNNMSKRLFFPLTETANKDPQKMGEWQSSIKNEDKELARRTAEREKLKKEREYRKKYR